MCKHKEQVMVNQALLEEALKALKFYADKNNWTKPIHSYSSNSLPSSAMLDGGHIARRVITFISNATDLEEA